MTNLKAVLALGAMATTLAACGDGGDPELAAKIEENFTKQMYGSCSMEYIGSGLDAAKKEELCNCVAEGMLAKTELPKDGMGQSMKITAEDIIPVRDKCEAETGVEIEREG